MCRATLLILLVAGGLSAQAPAGFRTFQDADSGLTLYWPTAYAQIPLEPTESTLKARWRRSRTPSELSGYRRAPMPELAVFLFEERTATTISSGAKEEKEEEPAAETGPTSIREAMEAQGEVRNFAEFMKKKLPGYVLREVDAHEGHFLLERENGRGGPLGADITGYLVRFREGARHYGIYGLTLGPHLDRLKAEMAVMLRGLELPSAAEAKREREREARKWERFYGRKDYAGSERRIAVRLGLAAGWQAEDTENYIIVHHSKNRRLIARIERDIEAMRELYAELFPPAGEVDAVSVVRVCRNRDEYIAYGGSPGSGGFWHPGNEELVFYDYRQDLLDNEARGRDSRRRTSDQDSLLVLYHEAFHQYIFYAVGEISPHYWFNEGHGDYFSGAVISRSGKVLRVGPSWWRLHLAKDMMEAKAKAVDLETLLEAPRRIYYNPRNAARFYAAGWSFCFFMRESEEVAEHPVWSGFLDTYFETLKSEYERELKKRGEDANLGEKQAVQALARKRAIETAKEGVDLAELEEAWKRFIIELRDPWPERRDR